MSDAFEHVCPSGLDLARMSAGELDEVRSRAIGTHATPCRRCADRLREIEEARAELFGRDPNALAAAALLIAAEVDERAPVRRDLGVLGHGGLPASRSG